MSRSKACENLRKILLILHETLRRIGVVPSRRFESVGELKKVCEGIDAIIIDAVERAHRKPGIRRNSLPCTAARKKGIP